MDCQECGQSFPERDQLLSHVLCIHVSERSLPRLECGEFLAAHRNARPREPQLFTCIDCHSSFAYEEQEAGRICAQLALGKLFKCFSCSCKSPLAPDQKPFGQPGSLYYR